MPNWITTELRFANKEDYATAVKLIKRHITHNNVGEDVVDFGMLIPMPVHQPDLHKPNPFYAEGGLGQEEKEKYGKNNWYDWSWKHWGTKWNACSSEFIDADCKIKFETAWSPAIPVFEELAKHVDFEVVYADEDYQGTHHYFFADGKVIDEYVDDLFAPEEDDVEVDGEYIA